MHGSAAACSMSLPLFIAVHTALHNFHTCVSIGGHSCALRTALILRWV